jgi:hypothetical protein
MRVVIGVVAVLSLVVGVATPSASATSAARCNNAEFASGELTVTGVSCSSAVKVIHKALQHPGCTPSAKQRANSQGCNGSTKVNGWTCSGLFPGEGYDLKCRKGKKMRIHAGAGG